jgi:quercetin dioxygenase-like cupin family protein
MEEMMRRLEAEATSCCSWSNGPGDRYAVHAHAYEKVLYCVHGSITFRLDDEARDLHLEAGDRMVLAAGTRHSAVVGPGGCVCIEGRRGSRGADRGEQD